MGREEVIMYLFVVPPELLKTVSSLQAPYLLIPVQQPALHVFHHQICSSWLISYLPPLRKVGMLSL